ncbi:MAG: RIP metalloprotease RseP [Chloroflexota bacterium]|nr:RIP metalloprotease RseP [Chloroflexota bacterium]
MGNFSWILIVPILAVLVTVHEFGHFLAARLFGVAVEEFGIGLPPRIIGRMWKGTLWSLNAIPLGGFARMKDENASGAAADSFQTKPAYARAIILVAGIVFNFIFAAILFAVIFAVYGAPSDKEVVSIGDVVAGTPAQAAGWQAGDRFVRIGGQPINTQQDLSDAIKADAGRSVQVELRRGGQIVTTTITPRQPDQTPTGQGSTGITVSAQSVAVREPVWRAIPDGFRETGRGIGATYSGLVHLVRGQQPGGVSNLTGPVGIAQVVGEVVQQATIPVWVVLFNLTAFISINLGILNLLPIPALDGGRLLFVVIEWVRRGKRVPPEREGMVHLIGMAVLLTIFVLVAFLDIQRILDGRSILPR